MAITESVQTVTSDSPAPSYSKRVAAEVRAQMARQRRSGVELARVLHMSQQSLSRRMTGDHPFDVAEIEIVANWLGIDPAQLMTVSA